MGPGGRVVIRAPNHLGELVMSLGALRSLGEADILVRDWLIPLLEAVGEAERENGAEAGWGGLIPLAPGNRGLIRAARRIRAGRYRRGILLTGSFSSASIFALAGVPERRGVVGDGRSFLLTEPIPRERIDGLHRAAAAGVIAGSSVDSPEAGRMRMPSRIRGWAAAKLPTRDGPWVGVFPGASAPARRWDPDRFEELVRRLDRRGFRTVVFGGPHEVSVASRIAGKAAVDLVGRTSLPQLAAALGACTLVVANDSGPLHLAAAMGASTVSLWGAGDPPATGVFGTAHEMLRRSDLPCVPCVRNRCPRTGRGYLLPEAERECLRLIGIGDVEAVVVRRLDHPHPSNQ